MGANADFVNAHPNTVLRFLSVVWRIMDEMKKDPALFDIQAPYLNSVAGTSFDGKGVAGVVNELDPFAPFEYGETFYHDPKSARYYRNLYTAIIDDYVAHNIIPKAPLRPMSSSGEQRSGGRRWITRTRPTSLWLTELKGKTLAADKQALLDKAQQFYGWYDFLDAYRLATAASS